MITDIKTELAGKWSSVLQSIGFQAAMFNGKHQPCFYCEGKDRARWVAAKEYYHCNQCGSHQPIEMAMQHLSKSYQETAKYLRPNLRTYKMEPTKPIDIAANEARLKKIHAGLKRITPDSIAALYFAKRGITVLPETDCYFHPSAPYYQDGKLKNIPAIVSIFRSVAAAAASLHITYIDSSGLKASVETSRKILPPILPLPGSAIRLFKADDILCIAEGIETALSVYEDTQIPTWAAGNAGNMAAMQVPESIKTVWIYADNDHSFTGQQAAYTLAKRLINEGKTVRVVNLIDSQPVDDYGTEYDYNDYMILKKAA